MKIYVLIALCIGVACACSSGNGGKMNKTQEASFELERSYHHDYKAAEALYAIADVYGIPVSEEEFHELMENPINAEKFLNNMFEAGVLDEKKEILFWLSQLYNGIPIELEHLDLCRGLDRNCQGKDDAGGTDDDLVESLFRLGPASVEDVFGKTIDEDDF